MRTANVPKAGASVFVLALAIFRFLPAQATEVWVGPSCVSGGAGTQANPYCKIQTAICNIKAAGGTVHVLPGTYLESIRIPATVQVISTDGPAVTTLHATGKPCPQADFCTIGAEPNCSAVYFPTAARHRRAASRVFTSRTPAAARTSPSDRVRRSARGSWSSGRPRRSRATRSSATRSRARPTTSSTAPGSTSRVLDGRDRSPGDHEQSHPRKRRRPAGRSEFTTYPSEGDGGGIYVGYYSAPIITGNTIKANRAGNSATLFQADSGGGIAMYSITPNRRSRRSAAI